MVYTRDLKSLAIYGLRVRVPPWAQTVLVLLCAKLITMLDVILWLVVFAVSLAVLLKGADWLLASAERIGLAIGLSPFVVGVIIVAVGTSFPELVSSFAALSRGLPEIVAANAIGSNIANILLIIVVTAVVARRISVTKNLIDLDLPLLAISTVLFLGIAWDGEITRIEAILMLITYGFYLVYSITHEDDELEQNATERAEQGKSASALLERTSFQLKDILFLVFGVIGLVIGAQYVIRSVVELSSLLNIAPGVISIVAVAFGTSLPELLVSVRAAMQNKPEIALGNVLGSNVFNLLVVVGLPGLFSVLPLDVQTLTIRLPYLAIVTLLFIISGISRHIHIWEGNFCLATYVLFIGKIFQLF